MLKETAIVVDPDHHTRTALTMPLRAWGYRVEEAASTHEAEALLASMPETKCLLLGAALKSHELEAVCQVVSSEFENPPAVLVECTATDIDARIAASANLIVDFFLRPVALTELRERLRRANVTAAERMRFRKLKSITERQATLDPETGVLARRLILDRLEQENSRSQRNGRPLSVLLFMLQRASKAAVEPSLPEQDMFTFARQIANAVRRHDITGRIDASKILVVLPDTDSIQLKAAVTRFRSVLSDEYDGKTIPGHRVSIGGISSDAQMHCVVGDLLAAAENSLFAASQKAQAIATVCELFSESPTASGD